MVNGSSGLDDLDDTDSDPPIPTTKAGCQYIRDAHLNPVSPDVNHARNPLQVLLR